MNPPKRSNMGYRLELTVIRLRDLLRSPAGILSVSDHHLREAPLLAAVTGGHLFRSAGQTRNGIFRFERLGADVRRPVPSEVCR